jgi:C1A family cysteine protease
MRKLGWIRSGGNLGITPFTTSTTLQSLAAPNSANQYIIPTTVPVFDQLDLSSCVANSTCIALMILSQVANNSFTALSRLMIYWNARVYTQDTDKDQGTFIHLAFQSLASLGVCEETVWPYDASEVFAQPPLDAYKQGNDNTISTFYEITSTGAQRVSDIELAIRANHPVVFGTNVGQDLEDYNGDPTVVFSAPTTSLGGHAIAAIGVRINSAGQREFLIRNSWGSGWGIGGCAWFSSAYMEDDSTSDLFVPTQIANLLV